MKFKIGNPKTEDADSSYDIHEVKGLIRDRNFDALVGKFLTILADRSDSEGLVVAIRGGPPRSVPLCEKCYAHKVWVGPKEDRHYVCPNCLWQKMNEVQKS